MAGASSPYSRATDLLSARAGRRERHRGRATLGHCSITRCSRRASRRLYEWSAEELAEPRIVELVRDGNPIYAWPYEERRVAPAKMPFAGRILERLARVR